jgi:hypothetical protein
MPPLLFSYYLRLHREALGLDWQGQALRLGISRERLTDMALCRCPDWRRPGDVARFAEGIGVPEAAVREVLSYAGQ